MMPLYCSQGHENSADSRFCRQCGEQLGGTTPGPQPLLGQLLGLRYRVVRELGRGGFGRTYLAEDAHRFNELCVLKEFAPAVEGSQALQKAEELFQREAGIMYQLQHPQIPRFRELFRTNLQGRGQLFLVQDYVEGQTYQEILQRRLTQGWCFTEPEVLQLLCQVLPVLEYIHSRGVVHRDISPDNLIQRSTDQLPVLIDFGGVKQVAAAVASQVAFAQPILTRLGKAGYAPLEQMQRGEVSAHSDLYALAVTVLVLLTGKEPLPLLENTPQAWQQQVTLSYPLVAVLERMLSPRATQRYQTAAEVLHTLNSFAMPSAQSIPPSPNPQPPIPATIPLAPPASSASPSHQHQPAAAVLPQPRQRSTGFGAIALLLLLTGGAGVGWFAGSRWLQPFWVGFQTDRSAPTDSPDYGSSDPQLPPAEQERKQALSQRRQQLGINHSFLVQLVNQEFYARHPQRQGQPLTASPEDETLRSEWDKIASNFLEGLQTLSPQARSRLGQYTAANLTARQASVNQLNLSSRTLNDLTDVRFFSLFPEQPRNQNLLKLPIGQVWQAIATDQLTALQDGRALERIQFAPGRFAQQVSGSLKPGEGKAFTASLQKDQMLRLDLQATGNTHLSLYPPTSKTQPLLQDSPEIHWTGKLTETGIYEIAIVSNSSNPVNYTLNLAAADEVSTPGGSGE
jgi:serine/threonine-protein kinase